MSTGLAGAVIGNMVAGRLGAAIGAVVGGVAGVALSQTEAVEDAVDAVKHKVEDAKPAIQNAIGTVQDKAENAKSAAMDAVSTVQDKTKGAVDSIQHKAEDARSAAVDTVDSAQDKAQNAQPDVMNTVETASPTVGTTDIQAAVETAMPTVSPVETAMPTASSTSELPIEDIGNAYISSDPSFDAASIEEQYDRGITLGKQGDLVGSIAAFQAVIERDPSYAEAHYNLGVVLGQHGFREQGIEHIQKSRELCEMQGRTREASNIDQILLKLGAQ